jgi:hypothetical protein
VAAAGATAASAQVSAQTSAQSKPTTQAKPAPAAPAKPRPATGTTAAPAAAPGTAKPKQHQATGIVASSAPAQLAILKQFGRNKTQWTFVVNAKTAFDAKPAKGARVRILYHEDKSLRVADRVKILEAAPAAKSPAAKPAAAPAPKSSPAPPPKQ